MINEAIIVTVFSRVVAGDRHQRFNLKKVGRYIIYEERRVCEKIRLAGIRSRTRFTSRPLKLSGLKVIFRRSLELLCCAADRMMLMFLVLAAVSDTGFLK